MLDSNFLILYVDDPLASAQFYGHLLGRTPIESSATFALFATDTGLMLGLWARHAVEPGVEALGVGGEVAFAVAGIGLVNAAYQMCRTFDIPIIQTPCTLDFGYTFVAVDPDGHRLRVFSAS
jgi:predicted enzyme related to lactoylglutathione lyase